MFKFLKDVVSGSGAGVKDLPYNIGEPYSSAWGSWTHSRGTSKDDGSPVSIFSLTGSNANDGHLAAGRNGVKRLRTVRHPNILSFLHSTEAEISDGSSTKVIIYIVTEPVMPLAEKIKELGLQGTQRNEYYAWGLSRIAKAVSFLNNDCKLVHGNVCLESVVVTPTLDWKLHAFDALSEFDGNNEASTGPMLSKKQASGNPEAATEKKKLPEKVPDDKDKDLSVSLLKIQVGLIRKASKHPSADSLLVEEIDVGESKCRQVVSGLAKYCSPDDLTNRLVALITNVKPGKLRDVVSEGLVLCASNADHTAVEPLIVPEGAKIGECVTFSGHEGKPEDVLNPKKKQLDKITPNLFTNDKGVATFKGVPFMTSAGPCTSTISNATIK